MPRCCVVDSWSDLVLCFLILFYFPFSEVLNSSSGDFKGVIKVHGHDQYIDCGLKCCSCPKDFR